MSKSPDAFRTISEVADWLDTPAHVLRFWESRFTQVKPVKRAGGRRYYRPADMALLGGIKKLLHNDGMTIRGVQKLLREHGVRYVAAMSPEIEGVAPIVAPSASSAPIPPAPMSENVPQDSVPTRPDAETVIPFARPTPRKTPPADPGQTAFDFNATISDDERTTISESASPAPVEEFKAPGDVSTNENAFEGTSEDFESPGEVTHTDLSEEPVEEFKAPGDINAADENTEVTPQSHEDFGPTDPQLREDVFEDTFYDAQQSAEQEPLAPVVDTLSPLGTDLVLPDDPENDAEAFAPSEVRIGMIDRRVLAQLAPNSIAALLTRAEALHARLTASV